MSVSLRPFPAASTCLFALLLGGCGFFLDGKTEEGASSAGDNGAANDPCASEMPPSECKEPRWSNVDENFPTEGLEDYEPSNDYPIILIDSDSGSIVARNDAGQERVLREAGEGLNASGIFFALRDGASSGANKGIFLAKRWRFVEGTQTRGVGTRALILLSLSIVRIEGLLQVSANAQGPGPGGFAGGGSDMAGAGAGGGQASGSADSNADGGGGGGAYGTSGGAGGRGQDLFSQRPGGPGGNAYGSETLIPLIGGSGGGGGGHPGGQGGHGGGAIQIGALGRIVLDAGGIIDASGGGGKGGIAAGVADRGAGGGGGSGGAILLESRLLVLNGALISNGGAGGQGAVSATLAGAAGTGGNPTEIPAPAAGTEGNGGGGGIGSDDEGRPGAGQVGVEGGGGGGSGGRIRLNTLGSPDLGNVRLSPTPAAGLTTFGPLLLRN